MRDFFVLLCITLCFSSLYGQSLDTYNDGNYVLISDEEIKERLSQIHSDVVKPRFDPAVRSYIRTYTIKQRARTEEMLGRTVMYFPMFERLLIEGGLPTDLKYLSVVESALNANAVSRSGAVGLWQFMKPTGRECGLSINRTVDERKDPEKATRAAIKYLARQYKRYGNWELALAAYNGGAGRVNRAIKRGRSKNFWKIRRHLPRETRSYVPAFIAATYINQYYHRHNLSPIYPDVEFQKTEMVKVYNTLTFAEVEEITGTPEYVIEYLNPSYKKKYLPSTLIGNNFVLPEDRMAIFKNYYKIPDSGDQRYTAGGPINVPRASKPATPVNARQLYYRVEGDENMESLAQSFYCSESDIMRWNKLTSRTLRRGQNLLIYISRDAMQPVMLIEPIDLAVAKPIAIDTPENLDWQPIALPAKKGKKLSRKARRKKAKEEAKRQEKLYVFHKIERGESLLNIAAQYKGVSVNDIIQLNNIQSAESLKEGMKLKIRKK